MSADDPEASRPHFEGLHALRDCLQDDLGRPLPVLSMGMSHDFEVAVACGATHVRIGTAIFGSRGCSELEPRYVSGAAGRARHQRHAK